MAEEKTNVNTSEEPKQPQGWKDIQLNTQMPLDALVGFFNVLNQRLCSLEDVIKLDVDGVQKSISEIYAEQAKLQQEQMNEQSNQSKGE